MPRRTKKPAGPPPDASLLGIPPEMRNAIYRLVVDDIDEVSIIGRRLDSSKATSTDHAWLWDTMAKHPLSQTCRQLRQEFDPVHRHRALTTGVAQYCLELEDFDVERINVFAEVVRSMPKTIQGRLKETVDGSGSIIRFNLTYRILSSIDKLKRRWRNLDSTFSRLRRALNSDTYYTYRSHEINLNFKHRTMSSAQKKLAPAQSLVAAAKSELRRLCGDADRDMIRDSLGHQKDWPSAYKLETIFENLNKSHNNHFRPMREAREQKASEALTQRLESEIKARLREELKAELRAEIMNELKDEAEAELERQI